MNSARSLSKLLISGAAVAALVSSCTIQTKSDSTTGGTSAGTTGGASTTGGSAATTGGAPANTGGAAATGGSVATTGGAAATGGSAASPGGAGGNAAGAGGDGTGAVGGNPAGGEDAGGQGGASFDDCDACLDAKCTAEFNACFEDIQCFSDALDGSGQFEQIIACTEQIRVSRPVRRVDLRTCGTMVSTIGSTLWPPEDMTTATTNLVNCLATGQSGEDMNNDWAINSNINNVWPASSCAKLACTSQLP